MLPATDDRLRTWIGTPAGEFPFQEWFVARGHRDEVDAVRFEGEETHAAAPGVLEAIADADLILLAPSNPYVSIGPILAVAPIREALAARRVPSVAVSPLIGGRAVKGPADRMLARLAGGTSPAMWPARTPGLIDALVVDEADADDLDGLGEVRPIVTRTLMTDAGGAATARRGGARSGRRVKVAVARRNRRVRLGARATARGGRSGGEHRVTRSRPGAPRRRRSSERPRGRQRRTPSTASISSCSPCWRRLRSTPRPSSPTRSARRRCSASRARSASTAAPRFPATIRSRWPSGRRQLLRGPVVAGLHSLAAALAGAGKAARRRARLRRRRSGEGARARAGGAARHGSRARCRPARERPRARGHDRGHRQPQPPLPRPRGAADRRVCDRPHDLPRSGPAGAARRRRPRAPDHRARGARGRRRPRRRPEGDLQDRGTDRAARRRRALGEGARARRRRGRAPDRGHPRRGEARPPHPGLAPHHGDAPRLHLRFERRRRLERARARHGRPPPRRPRRLRGAPACCACES